MIIVLIIASIVSGIVGYYEGEGITDAIIILIVVIVNAIIGVNILGLLIVRIIMQWNFSMP